jgi:hypothetical protein
MTFAFGSPMSTLVPGRYDIVLRPSLKDAEAQAELTSAWMGDDIVIEDVGFLSVGPEADDATSPIPSPSPG